ncbi:MAG: stalk domain-containing protein [Cellulosilyticaceae bacterium]
MKRFMPTLSIACLVMGCLTPCLATTSSIVSNTQSLVPIRTVGESLGYKVIWDTQTKSVTIKDGDSDTTLSLGSTSCKLPNQSTITLSEPPKLVDGSLVVSAEFWSQAFHLDVKITDGNLTITKPDSKPPIEELDDIITPLKSGVNEVYTHQKLGIRLIENPSTGYTWDFTLPDGLELISNTYSSDNPKILGSPGTRHLIIRATKAGTYNLIFKNIRTSQPENPIDTQTFTIKAKDFQIPSH